MANSYDYTSEDNIRYKLFFAIKAEIIELILTRNNNYFKSIYRLEFLNDKFGKKASFKNLSDFKNLLKKNISKNSLIIKPIYRTIIRTIWKIKPGKKDSKETFTLLSYKNINDKLSILFYSNYKIAEKAIKELINQEFNKNINKEEFIKEDNKLKFNNVNKLEINSTFDNINDISKNEEFINQEENISFENNNKNFLQLDNNTGLTNNINIINIKDESEENYNINENEFENKGDTLEYNNKNSLIIDNIIVLNNLNDQLKKEALFSKLNELKNLNDEEFRTVLVFFLNQNYKIL